MRWDGRSLCSLTAKKKIKQNSVRNDTNTQKSLYSFIIRTRVCSVLGNTLLVKFARKSSAYGSHSALRETEVVFKTIETKGSCKLRVDAGGED